MLKFKNKKENKDIPIDFVVAYVNQDDVAWQQERSKYMDQSVDLANNANCRYRDWGTLKYWFRATAKYAPWVNRIYLVIDRATTIPSFLNLNSEKIKIVYHDEFIPSEYLPTYNACTIELFLHRIPNISEHFVYFNDDMFLLQAVNKSDFFIDGLPCYMFREYHFRPLGYCAYDRHCYNNIAIINDNFDKRRQVLISHPLKYTPRTKNIKTLINCTLTRLHSFYSDIPFYHTPNPFRKSTYYKVWDKNRDLLNHLASHRFRTFEDVNQYLFAEWDIASGDFKNRNINSAFFTFYNINEKLVCIQAIREHKFKFICVNDSESIADDEIDNIQKQVRKAFDEILPELCEYEKK